MIREGFGFGWVKIILTKYRCNAGADAKNTLRLNYPEKAMMSSDQSNLINDGGNKERESEYHLSGD